MLGGIKERAIEAIKKTLEEKILGEIFNSNEDCVM